MQSTVGACSPAEHSQQKSILEQFLLNFPRLRAKSSIYNNLATSDPLI